jgi:hypothetical protein
MVCNEWVVFQGLQLRKMRYEQCWTMVDKAVAVLLLMVVFGNAKNAGGSPARDFSP